MASQKSKTIPFHGICLFTLVIGAFVLSVSCVSTRATGDSVAKAAPAAVTNPSPEPSPIWRADPTSEEVVYLPLDIHFPRKTDHLVFGKKTVFDDKGRDVSVGYNSPDLPLWLTFYVYLKSYYPQKDTLAHFQAVVGDVLTEWPKSKVESAQYAHFNFGTTNVDGMIALVHYGKGPTPGEWGGYALLLPYGNYYVYVRASFRGVDNEATVLEVRNLMVRFLTSLHLPAPVGE